ncbi:unnamed protein product [Camellia sinensis]
MLEPIQLFDTPIQFLDILIKRETREREGENRKKNEEEKKKNSSFVLKLKEELKRLNKLKF